MRIWRTPGHVLGVLLILVFVFLLALTEINGVLRATLRRRFLTLLFKLCPGGVLSRRSPLRFANGILTLLFKLIPGVKYNGDLPEHVSLPQNRMTGVLKSPLRYPL